MTRQFIILYIIIITAFVFHHVFVLYRVGIYFGIIPAHFSWPGFYFAVCLSCLREYSIKQLFIKMFVVYFVLK